MELYEITRKRERGSNVIKLDGKSLCEFGLMLEPGHTHPSTEVINNTISIPGRVGSWDFGSEIGDRSFSFPLGIIEPNKFEMQRKIRAFVTFLFNEHGKPRNFKLSFDYEPDKYYIVKISSSFNPTRLYEVSEFTLPLIAYDPYARFIVSSGDIIMDSDIPVLSDVLWETGFSNRLITGIQTFEIVNNGTLTIPFTFKLEGNGKNVELSVNGKTMSLGSFTNKTIEVSENYTVKVNGVSNLTISNGVFLELLPGINTIQITGSNLNLTISESLTYKYI